MRDTVSNGRDRIEVNTIEAIRNSSNKFKMKCLFTEDSVETADWWRFDRSADSFKTLHSEEGLVLLNIEELPYPIVSKNIFGSRNTGNIKHDNPDSLRLWMEGKNLDNYIFEKFYNYVREYRLHVTQDGCFYAIRKMLKRDTPEEYRWYRNDDHCVWILEDNEAFDKPVNWDDIVDHSVKALKAVGLDIGAIDVKVQSATKSDGSPR